MARKPPSASNQETTWDPVRLTIPQLVEVLRKSGSRQITSERIESDLASGAPRNADGTLHLVHYAAWIMQQLKG